VWGCSKLPGVANVDAERAEAERTREKQGDGQLAKPEAAEVDPRRRACVARARWKACDTNHAVA